MFVHCRIALSTRTSSSGPAIPTKMLHGNEKIYYRRSIQTSYQGEDTLNFSSWGGCKIPKFLKPKKILYWISSPEKFSSHTNEFCTKPGTWKTSQNKIEEIQIKQINFKGGTRYIRFWENYHTTPTQVSERDSGENWSRNDQKNHPGSRERERRPWELMARTGAWEDMS